VFGKSRVRRRPRRTGAIPEVQKHKFHTDSRSEYKHRRGTELNEHSAVNGTDGRRAHHRSDRLPDTGHESKQHSIISFIISVYLYLLQCFRSVILGI